MYDTDPGYKDKSNRDYSLSDKSPLIGMGTISWNDWDLSAPEKDISGGVRPEATYEVYGEFGAGKTQFCNSLTVETIHDGNNVIWIDCEDTFKPNRIAEMLKAREYAEDDEEVGKYLNQITYLYCPNTEQLMGTINGLSKILDDKKPKLVVLDGAIGQFRDCLLYTSDAADE